MASAFVFPAAVVLAGGRGTRIASILPDLPKPLAPTAGQPFLHWVTAWLIGQGARDIIYSTGYKAEAIDAWVAATPIEPGVRLRCQPESVPLGTGGGLLNCLELVGDYVVLTNGDSLADCDLAAGVARCIEQGLEGMLFGLWMDDASRYGTLAVDAKGMLAAFHEKRPGSGLINSGLYVFRTSVLRGFDRTKPSSIEVDVIPQLLAQGCRIAVQPKQEAAFIDIGTPETIAQASAFILANPGLFRGLASGHGANAGNVDGRSGFRALAAEADMLTDWLFGQSLPVWWNVGADRVAGGFHEKISQDGRPTGGARRTRVVARQIYSFATAARMGWDGPAEEAVDHGLAFFFDNCRRPDGLLITSCKPDGQVVDGRYDLYDQAFGMFALAAAAPLRDAGRLEEAALAIARAVKAQYAHDKGGFYDVESRELPLKSNPHMHTFEASLAWLEAKPDADALWGAIADEIGALAIRAFIQPDGYLLEFFDLDWNPMRNDAGRIVEPGHQFEWAWLLMRWGRLRNRSDAIAAGLRLIEIAENHGVCPDRGVIHAELWSGDMTPKNAMARLWPQTERIKANIYAASILENADMQDRALTRAAAASQALRGYFGTPTPGIWYDWIDTKGQPVVDDAPASSLYHIVCGMDSLRAWRLWTRGA